MKKQLLIALGLSSLATIHLHAQPAFQGDLLTDPAGKTLYVFDKDQAGKSNCSGACLQAWPAYTADAAAGTEGASTAVGRLASQGVQQWTWNKLPLYYFAGDQKPGDRTGDGSGGVWHVVKRSAPAAVTSTTTPGYSY